jgi:DNA repair protein RecN (Recombination protein N)
MLKLLRINNIALVPALEVEFGPGLTLLTGETGAGKSILIDALGLLLGNRASTELVRTGEDRAIVEGVVEGGRSRRSSRSTACP